VIGLLVAAVAGPVRADPATDGAVLRAQLVALSATVARYEQWSSCLRVVTVRERGDPMGSDGYRFDAGDGTGISYRTALALAPGAAAAADTYDLLDVRDDGTCVGLRASPAIGTDRKSLRAAVRRVALAVHRFDAWESCLTPIAVSEFGDADGRFGYEVGASGGRTRWRAAISVDRTDPEDPDYLLFAQQRGGAVREGRRRRVRDRRGRPEPRRAGRGRRRPRGPGRRPRAVRQLHVHGRDRPAPGLPLWGRRTADAARAQPRRARSSRRASAARVPARGAARG
jgi:hypothetical protein